MSGEIITLDDYFSLHGRPESQALIDNATITVSRWNEFLSAALKDGVYPTIDDESKNFVASGYRPEGVNAATKNAEAASKHLTCQACDVRDAAPGRPLMRWIMMNLALAEEIGLWFEDPRWTWRPDGHPWCHGQIIAPGSGHRVFIPSSKPPLAPPLDR